VTARSHLRELTNFLAALEKADKDNRREADREAKLSRLRASRLSVGRVTSAERVSSFSSLSPSRETSRDAMRPAPPPAEEDEARKAHRQKLAEAAAKAAAKAAASAAATAAAATGPSSVGLAPAAPDSAAAAAAALTAATAGPAPPAETPEGAPAAASLASTTLARPRAPLGRRHKSTRRPVGGAAGEEAPSPRAAGQLPPAVTDEGDARPAGGEGQARSAHPSNLTGALARLSARVSEEEDGSSEAAAADDPDRAPSPPGREVPQPSPGVDGAGAEDGAAAAAEDPLDKSGMTHTGSDYGDDDYF